MNKNSTYKEFNNQNLIEIELNDSIKNDFGVKNSRSKMEYDLNNKILG